MYGIRKEITHELKRQFAADEVMVVLIWTTESVMALAQSHGITDVEADSVLYRLGKRSMQEYQQYGISCDTVLDELMAFRAEQRPVQIPADRLARLVRLAEQALEIQEGIAQDDREPLPGDVIRGKNDIAHVRAALKD
jgi:hypothetical protein